MGRYICSINNYCDNNGECSVNSYWDNNVKVHLQCLHLLWQ